MQGKWRAVTVCLGWSVRRGGLHGVSFTAQHLLGGDDVLKWSSPSGSRKEGRWETAHTLAFLHWSLRFQRGWVGVGRVESSTSSWRPDSIP